VPIGQRWQYSRGHRAIFHMALGQHWYFFMWHYVKTWHLANSGTSRPLLVAIGQSWQYSRGNRQFCTWHLTNTGTSWRGTMFTCNIQVATGQFCYFFTWHKINIGNLHVARAILHVAVGQLWYFFTWHKINIGNLHVGPGNSLRALSQH